MTARTHPAWFTARTERPRARRAGAPRVGAVRSVDLDAARRGLRAAWSRLAVQVSDVRADPDPLGSNWRAAWTHQIQAFRGADGGDMSADEITVWARRLRPWIDEFVRRTRVPGVGTIWTASALRSLVRRVNQRIRSVKSDVEAWAAELRQDGAEPTAEQDEWLRAWRAWFVGWAGWLGDNCIADGDDPCASFGVIGDVITWGSTADEVQAFDRELDGWRDRFVTLSGRQPSSAADSDSAVAARQSSGFLSGLFAGGASTALLGVIGLLAFASLRR
jgi:hypothetical protein